LGSALAVAPLARSPPVQALVEAWESVAQWLPATTFAGGRRVTRSTGAWNACVVCARFREPWTPRGRGQGGLLRISSGGRGLIATSGAYTHAALTALPVDGEDAGHRNMERRTMQVWMCFHLDVPSPPPLPTHQRGGQAPDVRAAWV
jgi:hypothetical protein